MSEPKHTPGPWIGAGPSFGDPLPRYTTEIVTEWEEDDNLVICELPFNYHDDENEANARLIAAAPELLEALKIQHECGLPEKVSLYDEECIEGWRWLHPDGREWTEIGDWNDPLPYHPVVASAIAKAEGDEK